MANDTHGQAIRKRIETRKAELEAVLDYLGAEGAPTTAKDIKDALRSLGSMLTGNLDNISPAVTTQLARWLETSKYLGMKETRELAAKAPATTPPK